jgi:hypothetical protein
MHLGGTVASVAFGGPAPRLPLRRPAARVDQKVVEEAFAIVGDAHPARRRVVGEVADQPDQILPLQRSQDWSEQDRRVRNFKLQERDCDPLGVGVVGPPGQIDGLSDDGQ